MAKQSVSKAGTSRIRFIMLDAEIPEGDLSQITTAIQNALKPMTITQQRLANQPAAPAPALIGNGAGELVDEGPSELDEEPAAPEAPRPPREPRVRKPTVRKVLELDLKTGVSLESFANQHPPKSELERNLVVAAWFKEQRNEDAITADHVYTCYRTMKWPAGIEDFSWPLRALKKEKLMSSAGRGQYAINHLGIARVQEMGSE
jgi:hypothetical protein